MNGGIDEKMLLAKARDTVSLCEKQYAIKVMGFLTPAEVAIIKSKLHSISRGQDIELRFFGGYPDAERCLFVAIPEYAEWDLVNEYITVLEITGRDIQKLNHRDFLGSLLGLGLKREKLGDILKLPDKALVFVLSDIADYIISNLDKVGRCGVKVSKVDYNDLEMPKRRFEEICTTVSALRLDCVASAALKTSRSNGVEAIKGGRVSVNWLETDNLSAKLTPGDVFSIRGVGRFRLSEKVSETKKGRLSIVIEKFL